MGGPIASVSQLLGLVNVPSLDADVNHIICQFAIYHIGQNGHFDSYFMWPFDHYLVNMGVYQENIKKIVNWSKIELILSIG